jgi:haloalkane dehalogenase
MMIRTRLDLPAFLRNEYPFDSNFINDREGNRLHYIDDGDWDVVLMLHGNPTWSYYYRNLIKELASEFRCIALDNIGCGLSDKPQDYDYCLENHIKNARTLAEALRVEKFHLIMHDWGCAIGMALAERWPEYIASITIMNGAAFLSKEIPRRIDFCRISPIAKFFILGLNAFAWSSTIMSVNYPMTKEIQRGYLYPYNSWKNRIATLRFVQDIPMDPDHKSWRIMEKIGRDLDLLRKKKALILWGQEDFCFTESFLKQWTDILEDADVIELDDCGHYILEDAKMAGINSIKNFLLNTQEPDGIPPE